MVDFTLPLRTIEGTIAVKTGECDDPRFKHLVSVGDEEYRVDDEGDTADMAGFFANAPGVGTAEITIAETKIRLGIGVPVVHAKRGKGTLVALRGRHSRDKGGFGILLEDGPQDDDSILWSINRNIQVLDGEHAFDADTNTLEIVLPEASHVRVLHLKRGPGTLVKVRSGSDKKALLGIKLDAGKVKGNGGLLWAAFRSVEIAAN